MISFYVDGNLVEAKKGQTILEAATKSGHYIPTMCYLPKLEPISSCRICVVEIEGSDELILSCQTPVVEGIKVTTDSKKLFEYRQNILKLYDVNHPLECGVCDKSGECLLQNRTLEFELDRQEFSAKEEKREIKRWGLIGYDPSLCILCERCVHTCNEIIGDDAIEIATGGYSSHIKPKGSDELDCSFCGECIAVCPVGALVSTGFKYISNSWELRKIPATCSHCPVGCAIYYEVKHDGTLDASEKRIYRVSNDFEYNSLCIAGRFGFDFENSETTKDSSELSRAVEAFLKADTIRFNSFITNEEALILQKLKEKRGYKLINSEAYIFREFLSELSMASGVSFYTGSVEDVKRSDFILSIGSRIYDDAPVVGYAINSAKKLKGAYFGYLHTIEDNRIHPSKFVKYEVGAEEGAIAALAYVILKDKIVDNRLQEYLDDLDIGYICSESNISEEELESLAKILKSKSSPILIAGSDLYSHKRAENIARLLGFIEKHSNFKVLLIPTSTNTLGVSLICDLDKEAGDYVIGYNDIGDYRLSSLGDGDLDMPALNQQEGTFTTIDKRVVPTNAALPYGGYELNDIAKELEIARENTIDYTLSLPRKSGYRSVGFDELDDEISKDGVDRRGYNLVIEEKDTHFNLQKIADIDEYNGVVVYVSNPTSQFSYMTNRARLLKDQSSDLEGSEQFSIAAKIEDGDYVSISFGQYEVKKVFKINPKLKGVVGILPIFDNMLSTYLLPSQYKYQKVEIKKASLEKKVEEN